MSDKPKPLPMKPSQSGQHMLDLVPKDPPMKPSASPPRGEQVIDVDKLLRAWESSTDVQRELIRVVEKAEADNRATRADNARTRRFVMVAMLTGLGFVAVTAGVILKRQAGLQETAVAMDANVQATLKAVRATALAVGAKIEADQALTPQSDEKAQKAAVEAQAEALRAERSVTEDPAAKKKATEQLDQLREKARVLNVHVDQDADPPKP